MAHADERTLPGLPAGSRIAERRLKNGLRLLAAEVPTACTVRLAAAIGAGYLDEPEGVPGLAHLLEHALFLGSPRQPRPGEFAAWVGEQGGRYNARTDEGVTDVHLTLPPAAAREGLARLVDLLVRPSLDEAAIGCEVDVLDAEFRARLADPALHRQAALSRLFTSAHPARHCHAGNRASLGENAALLRRQLADFHAANYRGERMSLVMLGPAPLESQLALLTAAGQAVSGDAPLPACKARNETGRWAMPAHIQWSLPEALAQQPRLELLWPLPPTLEATHPELLDRLAWALCDGRLATTLQRQLTITDLTATTRAEGTGTALSLTLMLTKVGARCIDRLRRTCQAAVHELPSAIADVAGPSPTAGVAFDQDLERWPLAQARRLARGLPLVRKSGGVFDEPMLLRMLNTALAPSVCRSLEAVSMLEEKAQTIEETGTPFRWCAPRIEDARAPRPAAWPLGPAPLIEARALSNDLDVGVPGRLDAGPDLALWWGGGPRQADACWCLAWPASSAGQASRLTAWHQRTLALRQSARTCGVRLTLGGDSRGDWLMARGQAKHLEAAVSRAMRAWRANPPMPSSEPTEGLLAQRLLKCLEAPTPSKAGIHRGPERRLLCWINGALSPAIARAGCRRLEGPAHVLLDETANAMTTTPEEYTDGERAATRWLPSQAEDHALMLQVDAPDASPTSRLVLWLLAQCHDAAFFSEMRQRRGLGYVAAVRYREAGGWPRLGYAVQSPHADVDGLRAAVSHFLAEQGVALATLNQARWVRCRTSLQAAWGPPETLDEGLAAGWHALRDAVLGASGIEASPTLLSPWKTMAQALATLRPDTVRAYAEALTNGMFDRQWWAHVPAIDDASRYA